MKNKNFPGFPSTTVFVGPPGRGKTNCFMNLLHNKNMWNKFFDQIYAFGPTVKSDKLYKTIKLRDENVCENVTDFIPKLKKALAKQQAAVEKSPSGAPKTLWIFEDMTSFYNKIQNQPEFQRCYTQCRHLKGSSVTMVHKYKAFNRTCRNSSQHLLIWKVNKTDIKHLYEDFGPTCMTDKDFYDMVNYAFTPTKDCPKPFFYINTLVPEEIGFRKNFNEILELRPNQENYAMMSNRNPRKSLKYDDPASAKRGRSRSPAGAKAEKRTRSRSPK